MDQRSLRECGAILLFATALAGCGAGGGSTCRFVSHVSQGNTSLRIENLGGTPIEAFLGDRYALGASLQAGECDVLGVQVGTGGTFDATVEITQCLYSAESGCTRTYGVTRREVVSIPAGGSKTITVGGGYFGSSTQTSCESISGDWSITHTITSASTSACQDVGSLIAQAAATCTVAEQAVSGGSFPFFSVACDGFYTSAGGPLFSDCAQSADIGQWIERLPDGSELSSSHHIDYRWTNLGLTGTETWRFEHSPNMAGFPCTISGTVSGQKL